MSAASPSHPGRTSARTPRANSVPNRCSSSARARATQPMLLLLFLLLLIPSGLRAQPAPLTGLDAYIEAAMRDWEIPGLAMAVVRNDSVIFAKGYGVTELGQSALVDEHTLFAIASTSKAFTSASLAILVDEGKLSWDDPVTKHLPGFELMDPYVTREITIRDLLTHRVGVARHDNIWIAAPFDRDEILRRARHLPMVAGFRDRYGYNNIMYITAGEVVGAVAGGSWDGFLEERIFGPLGMTRSSSRTAAAEARGNVAASHTHVEGRVQAVPRRDYDNIGGAGAVFSSAWDMAQWMRLHLGGGVYEGRRLLSDSALAEMYTPHTVIRSDSVADRMFPETNFWAYALGWRLHDYRGRKLVNHSGSINYTRTQVSMIPSENIGVVVMANLSSSNLQLAITYRVLDALIGLEPRDWSAEYLEVARRGEERSAETARQLEAARLPDTRPSLGLEHYAGTFSSPLFGEMRVTMEGGGLVLHYSPEYVADLQHWHQDIFRAVWRRPGAGRTFATFSIDERGRIQSLQIDGFDVFRRTRDPAETGGSR
jgi:CubicO group peptidase (beta-lactamase class C family)